jgi:modulator of FtsH protease
MGSAYNPAAWTGFFSAEVGASAALAGLIFVAVSINLAQIVKQNQLVWRCAEALLSLMGVLFSSSLCLIPDMSRLILGYELTALGVLIWAGTTLSQVRASRNNPYVGTREIVFHFLLTQLAAIPFAVGGVSLTRGFGGGLYWLAAGTVFSLAASLLDAWVLLIEIQR